MKIGFLDSGLGGAETLKEAVENGIGGEIYFLGDNKNVPYGIKSKEEIKKIVIKNIQTLINKGVEIIVIACNTATSASIEDVRKIYKDKIIIGIEPAIKVAKDLNDNSKNILVVATTLTVKEKKLNDLIIKLGIEKIVKKLALDELVSFAENDEQDKEKIKRYIISKVGEDTIKEYGSVVLGCTHFPIYRELFKEIFGENVHVVDGNSGITNRIKEKLNELNERKMKNENQNNIKIKNESYINQQNSVKYPIHLLLTKESNMFEKNFINIMNLNKEQVITEIIKE